MVRIRDDYKWGTLGGGGMGGRGQQPWIEVVLAA
jgi:hypothetical protein